MRRDPAALAPVDGRPYGTPIHATAVAIDDLGLLILGPSRAGKSRLALALIAAATPGCSIRLVGDDRILICGDATRRVARPHPRIAGFIERRGLGIVAMPFRSSVELRGLVRLGPQKGSKTAMPPDRENFPGLPVVNLNDERATDPAVLAARTLCWFRGACTTPRPKPSGDGPPGAKD